MTRNNARPLRKKNPMRIRNCGSSLTEMMVAMVIFSLLVASMILGLRAMAVGASQQVADSGIGLDARRGVDEMLMQMRYASGVYSSHTVGTQTYTTSNSTIVMTAVGYDPATVGLVLPGVTDYMIFQYDATKKEIRETLIPGTGSKRSARSNYLLARNVESIALTYRVREQYNQPVSGSVYPLKATSIATPLVTIKGVPSTGGWAPSVPKQITVNTTPGDDVQVLYPVSATDTDAVPLLSNTAAVPRVQQVDVAVKFSAVDSRGTTRKLTMWGSACLRNRRDAK